MHCSHTSFLVKLLEVLLSAFLSCPQLCMHMTNVCLHVSRGLPADVSEAVGLAMMNAAPRAVWIRTSGDQRSFHYPSIHPCSDKLGSVPTYLTIVSARLIRSYHVWSFARLGMPAGLLETGTDAQTL